MITTHCDRNGCDKAFPMREAGLSVVIPPGWHFHVDGEGRQLVACCDECWEILWGQRRWVQAQSRALAQHRAVRGERGEKRAMEELEVEEEKLVR